MFKLSIFLILVINLMVTSSAPNNDNSVVHHHFFHQVCTNTHASNSESQVGKYFLSYPVKANWYKAHKFCTTLGQDLVSIESTEKQHDIEEYLSSKQLNLKFNDWNVGIWTSGTDNGLDGNFFWMANGNDFAFNQWKIGEPNGGTGENCVAIWNVTNIGFRWFDLTCEFESYFICE